MAYENQSIKILMGMKDSLIAVVENLSMNKHPDFIDGEWLRLAQRILMVV